VIAARSESAVRADRLAEAVQRNLRSWWLDPGDRPVRVQITYAVGPDAVAARPTGAELALEYPVREELSPVVSERLGTSGRALIESQRLKKLFGLSARVVTR
jgi:hypothetical protein